VSDCMNLLDRLAKMGVGLAGLSDDSRQVRPGDLFVAYAGDQSDGRAHIADALARGAVAVLWQPGGDFRWNDAWKVPNLAADNLRKMVGPLAHALCAHPTESLALIAVTGTNGKTSVSQWIAHAHPKRCAVIGTLGAGFPEEMIDTGFTTPEAATLMRCLAEMREQGAQACALEASSIGIEEGRLNGAHVDVAVFTNMTRDHLDYHGDMDAYAAAKRKLFVWPRLRLAVVNLDDALGRQLARETTALKVLGYCLGDAHPDILPAVLRAENLETTTTGQRFVLSTPRGRVSVETHLLGRFNVSNLLAVAAVLVDMGLPLPEVAQRLVALTPPPGRLERVGGDHEPLVVVDYSHTPDALENALVTLRDVATARGGKLVAVFGCGGDRDRGKRPLMGEVATRCADQVVLTSDNPRSENPQAILEEIRVAAPAAEVTADRAAAIRQAVTAASADDVILLAGKGHEPYQEIMGVRSHFSDMEQAKAALLARRRQAEGIGSMRWSLAEIAEAAGGRLLGSDVVVQGVSTDTRNIELGQLFVAIRGDNFDAHDFLPDALQAGAVALVVSDAKNLPANVPAILVDDTRLALGRIAAAWRRSFNIPVLAVTGSNGKTTTKEMIAAILKVAYGDTVLATRGNLNNDIGLPMTLLGLDARHRVAVIEMGMNHPGEIAWLAGIAAPTVALVTNAQRAHLAGMGNLDAVAEEKGKIFGGMCPVGTAVINADDAYAAYWQALVPGRKVMRFSLERPADVQGSVHQQGLDSTLVLSFAGERVDIPLQMSGRHNAANALAAATACLAAGISLSAVAQGFAGFAGVKGRLQRRMGLDGALVLDDTYNANPDSVCAGIDVLASTIGKKILVLGDMGEVGEATAQYHDEVGGYAKSRGIDALFALGEQSQVAARNFGEGGRHFRQLEALLAALKPMLGTDVTVLVKGSRFMKMERVADAIAAETNHSGEGH